MNRIGNHRSGAGRRRMLAIATAGAVALGMGAWGVLPSGAATRSGSRRLISVDFANYEDSGPLFVGMQQGITSAAKRLRVKLHIYNNNASAETTLNNAKTMVLDRPDVVFEYDPVASVGARLGQVFSSAGVKCIAVNIPFSGCPQFNQTEVALAAQMGEQMAKLMHKRGWTGKNTTVVIMDHPQDGPAINDFVWKCYTSLAARVPNMTKIPLSQLTGSTTTIGQTGLQIDGGNTETSAYSAFQAGLASIPKQRNVVLFTIDDVYTIPAYRALVHDGRQKHAMISGFGASATALKALRTNPDWVLEGDSFFSQWGEFLMAMGQALLNGAKPPKLTLAPEIALSKRNLKAFYADGATNARLLPRLPKVDNYIVKTGVLQKFHNVEGIK